MRTKYQPRITEVGNNIRLWRVLKEHKQGDFATLLSISRAALSNIETGKTDVPISRLLLIAATLGVDVKSLFYNPVATVDKAAA